MSYKVIKIKKYKFAKMLALTLPIVIISIVTLSCINFLCSSNSTTTPDKPNNDGSGDSGTLVCENTAGSTQSYTNSSKNGNSINDLTYY